MNDIIDNVYDLMRMSREELDDTLLNDKYNKALLRELVRRSLSVANDYKTRLDLEKITSNDFDNALRIFENEVGFDFYSLLTNESIKQKFYDLNKNKDFSKYIDENKQINLEIEKIRLEENIK